MRYFANAGILGQNDQPGTTPLAEVYSDPPHGSVSDPQSP